MSECYFHSTGDSITVYNCITLDLFGIEKHPKVFKMKWPGGCLRHEAPVLVPKNKQPSPRSTQEENHWASHVPIVKGGPLCKWLLLEQWNLRLCLCLWFIRMILETSPNVSFRNSVLFYKKNEEKRYFAENASSFATKVTRGGTCAILPFTRPLYCRLGLVGRSLWNPQKCRSETMLNC